MTMSEQGFVTSHATGTPHVTAQPTCELMQMVLHPVHPGAGPLPLPPHTVERATVVAPPPVHAPLPESKLDDSPRLQRRTLYKAITCVFVRAGSPLEVQTAVRHKLQGLSEEQVCTFLDTTYQYLSERYLVNDTAAMQVVMEDLVNGRT